jgi:hypothetical protein
MKIAVIENPRPLTIEHYNDVANAPLSASLNCGYTLAIARRAGWDTAYMDLTTHNGVAADRAALILAEGADLVLFHWVYSWGHEQQVCDILDLLREEGSSPLGAFGLFPTLAGQRLLQYAQRLDFILAGEFEETLAGLLQGFDRFGDIPPLPGLLLRGHPFVARPLIDDLSVLPVPDDVGANRSYSSLNITASRGCYGECSFCFIHGFYGCSRRRTRRVASLEHELESRLSRRTIDSIYFIDPSFIGQGSSERERILEIGKLVQGLGLPFGFETRVDSVDSGLMETLAGNGADSVFLGIESGCDSVLERVNKRTTAAQAAAAVRAIRDNGIRLTVGFIMFEPDTTLEELDGNYAFLEEAGLLTDHNLTANLLYHNQIVLYGSAAWERFGREGRLLLDDRLPFEARYRFRDERVGMVCSAMGRLTAAYFRAMDGIRRSTPGGGPDNRPGVDGAALNLLLKESFRAFRSAAGNRQRAELDQLEKHYAQQLA